MEKAAKKTFERYVTEKTFEKHQDFMARQFKKVFEKFSQHDKVLELILQELQNNSREAREQNMNVLDLMLTSTRHEQKIDGFELRIEKLEQKLK